MSRSQARLTPILEMMFSEETPEAQSSRINDPIKNSTQKFLHNSITTGKYNYFTFIPRFLFEQFSKYANMFFLFIAIIQVIFIDLANWRPFPNE